MEKKFKKDIEVKGVEEVIARVKKKEIMGAKINLEMKIEPTIAISVGKQKLGSIVFDDIKPMGDFIGRLAEKVIDLIEEFNDEEKRAENRGVKCRS